MSFRGVRGRGRGASRGRGGHFHQHNHHPPAAFQIRVLLKESPPGIEAIQQRVQCTAEVSPPVATSAERIVTLTGNPFDVSAGIMEIASLGGRPEADLLVNKFFAGAIVGKGGAKIRETRNTGAFVKLSEDCLGSSGERMIHTDGHFEALSAAVNMMVHQLAEDGLEPSDNPYFPGQPTNSFGGSGGMQRRNSWQQQQQQPQQSSGPASHNSSLKLGRASQPGSQAAAAAIASQLSLATHLFEESGSFSGSAAVVVPIPAHLMTKLEAAIPDIIEQSRAQIQGPFRAAVDIKEPVLRITGQDKDSLAMAISLIQSSVQNQT